MKIKSPFFWLTLVLGTAFVVTAQYRSLNYVCGNDPMLYIRAARTFLAPGMYGSEALREAATFTAPGYPLILAVSLALFGSLAPYWVNVFFVLATLPFLYAVFHRLMRSERAACFSLLGLLWILFQGHELHAPFLLYPFREASRFFFVILCFWSLLRAQKAEAKWKGWTLLASGCMLAATGIREPTVFVLPGLLGGLMCFPVSSPSRWKRVGMFLLPWLLIGVVVFFLVLLGPLTEISQFSAAKYLKNHQTALDRMTDMLPWFVERGGGWIGCLLLITGMIRSWRNARPLFCWFALSGLLIFGFYGYMQMHVRYFMTTLIFLLPFAGYGLDGLLRVFESRIPAKQTACILTSLVLMAGVYGMIRTAEELEPWGPETSSEQVRAWQQRVTTLDKAADGKVSIALEQRCRYQEDLILSYTDARILDPKRTEDWPDAVLPATYFYPRNRAAFYATPQWLEYREVFAHRQIEHGFNLLPNGTENLLIGKGEYEQFTVSPFVAGVQEQTLEVQAGKEALLLLDWGGCSAESARQLSLVAGEVEVLSFTVSGKGIQAIQVPGDRVGAGLLTLRVTSESPMPAQPVFQVVEAGEPWVLELGTNRRLSSNFMLSNRKDDDVRAYYAKMRPNRSFRFRPPFLYSPGDGGLWQISPGLENWPAEIGWKISASTVASPGPQVTALHKKLPPPIFELPSNTELQLQLIPPETLRDPGRLNLRQLELQLGNTSSSR